MANEGAQKLREPRIENPFGGFRCKLSGLVDTSKSLYRQQKVTPLLRSLGGQRFYHCDILQQILWQTMSLL